LQSQSPKEALKLLRQIGGQGMGELGANIEAQKQRLRVVALPLLPTSEFLLLFEGDLRATFEFNLTERLRTRLVSLPLASQDEFKRTILSTLQNNTSEFVSGDQNTAQKWIEKFLASHQNPDAFIAAAPEFKSLTVEDQLRVQRLLQVVQHALISVTTPEGLEDEMMIRDETGTFKVLKAGELVELGIEPREKPPAAPPISAVPAAPSQIKAEVSSSRPIASVPPAPLAVKPVQKTPADFYFHPEDENEVHDHRARLAKIEPIPESNFDTIVDQLIRDFHLEFSGQPIADRFRNIIKSRLNDVRDIIETQNMLSRPIEVGGVGLEAGLAMKILSKVEEESLKIHQAHLARAEPTPLIVPVPTKATPLPPEPGDAVPPAVTVPPVVEKVVIPKAPPEIQKIEPKPVEPTPEPRPALVVPPIQKPKESPRPIPQRMSGTPVINRPIESSRPTVSDIRRPVKTIGPVQELVELTLKDYRRLGKTIEESNEKIMEKLDLLEEDSYLKRAEGVKAWKSGEVNQLYLSIGRESMEKDLAVIDVIRKRREDGLPYLTKEEFEMVADLNKKISF
ncbi:MAG: hypothetical protein PHH01_03260, partial [Patescibacteria group bacterium]|nr:hypothetical protein [Patescibacteria group bacterium]